MSVNLGGPAVAFKLSDLGLALPTIKQGVALGATIDLLETLGAARKLSEPSILCINNTPSTIYVGKTVSVITGKTTSTVTSESYTRQDIGLTLKIKPRIDSDNKVALKVEANIEDILPGSTVGMPITSKRSINTTTILENGQSIIIGGLVKNNKDITIQKVPFLGDIPIIGALFRHKNINDDQTTLAIILTPYIVKKPQDLEKLRTTLAKLSGLEKKFVAKIIKKKLKMKKKVKKENNNPLSILGEDYEER
jgi:general secretion pathway protein D